MASLVALTHRRQALSLSPRMTVWASPQPTFVAQLAPQAPLVRLGLLALLEQIARSQDQQVPLVRLGLLAPLVLTVPLLARPALLAPQVPLAQLATHSVVEHSPATLL